MDPSGSPSPWRRVGSVIVRADWEASCRRLAQAMVTASEPVTISNALMTVSGLEMWMQTRQRSLVPGLIGLDNFVHQGTPAPTRSLNALRWLSKLWWWAHLCWATWRNRLKAFSKPVIRPGPRCWALGWSRWESCATSISAGRCPRRCRFPPFTHTAHVENNGVSGEASISAFQQPSLQVGTGLVRGWSFGRSFLWRRRGVAAFASIPMGWHGI